MDLPLSSHPRPLGLWLALAITGAITGTVWAQSPPAWSLLSLPNGVVPSAIRQIGKVVTYTDATEVHAYSAFAHRWVTQPTGAGANTRVANDLALVVAGTTFHAFSAYTGAWSALTLSINAMVLNPAPQQNDAIWLVQDGSAIWAFAAYRGAWVRLPIGAGATAQVERNVALVVDGAVLHAFSAYHGAWVSTPALAGTTASRARGSAVVALSSAGVQGFSALMNTWASTAIPGPAAILTVHDDVQIVSDNGNHVAFSGLLGTFAAMTLPANASLTLGETLCYATDNVAGHWAYSAVRGSWLSLPTAAVVGGASISSNAVLLPLADRVLAYSAMTGTMATALVLPSLTALARSVGYLQGQDNSIHFFSAPLGRWFAAPAGTNPQISDVAGFVRTPTGYAAFSGRTGQFTALTTSSAATARIQIGDAVQAVIDTTMLHVFDPRRGRWLSAPLQSAPTIGTHRTTFMALDGNIAYGYGSYSARLTPIMLPTIGSIMRPNSESASIELANAIYAHSSVPDILTLWQYPEFRRVYVSGAPMEIQVQGSSGAGFVFIGLRLLANPVPFLGLGELELDPAGLIVLTGLPITVTQGHGVLRFPVPRLVTARGLEIAFQGLMLPAAGSPYLTQSTSVSLY
jgi:hypothetical protein